LIVLIESLLLS